MDFIKQLKQGLEEVCCLDDEYTDSKGMVYLSYMDLRNGQKYVVRIEEVF